jgi:hypothetical protein
MNRPSLPELPSLPDVVPDFVTSILDGVLDVVPILIDTSLTLI